MKILYVEDELKANIPKIENLFKKFLSKQDLQQLRYLKAQRRKTKEQIKQIVQNSGKIDVAYTFPMALGLLRNYQVYDLFIIDRNLSDEEYDFEELTKNDSKFQEKHYDLFFEREGDYILSKLVSESIVVRDKVFFLTANSNDELKRTERIDSLLDFGQFSKANIIDKTDDVEIDRLKHLIENNEEIRIKKEFAFEIEILRTISERAVELFIEIIKRKEATDRSSVVENLLKLRKLNENLLIIVAKNYIKERGVFNDYDEVNIGSVIYWLKNNEKFRLDSNALIVSYLYCIKALGSEYGSHEKLEETVPTTSNTVNALFYALLDIIRWFSQLKN